MENGRRAPSFHKWEHAAPTKKQPDYLSYDSELICLLPFDLVVHGFIHLVIMFIIYMVRFIGDTDCFQEK